MMITIDVSDTVPVYEQIVRQIVGAIRSGSLPAGSRLPTVRQLAGDLGLAVNTVAKAYKRLEAEGHVVTRGRNGTVVEQPRSAGHGAEEVSAAATILARAAQRQGLDLEAAVGVLRRAW